ncbi:hypothetical protein PRIPAC_87912 [Pristionchus pacificus]|uniref:Uncharacterized protein n=1 Tax=Pristionchus pacificus TaxID=54126 RepID=A0A454Y0A5_PRIPA|nr:hypothetical protein PRIPAC_87912 [Pristionchus pacificus]|eukprot:PDM60630.1 hypothetical protein PRIPAC_52092 [Pristionchus pacificus]
MRFLLLSLFFLAFSSSSVNADWWDDFTAGVSEKLKSVTGELKTVEMMGSSAANWVKETAGPAVRDKFNSVKETLQDPETHKQAKEWINEKAEAASEFAQTEILPELKKIYEAATAETTTNKNKRR